MYIPVYSCMFEKHVFNAMSASQGQILN